MVDLAARLAEDTKNQEGGTGHRYYDTGWLFGTGFLLVSYLLAHSEEVSNLSMFILLFVSNNLIDSDSHQMITTTTVDTLGISQGRSSSNIFMSRTNICYDVL